LQGEQTGLWIRKCRKFTRRGVDSGAVLLRVLETLRKKETPNGKIILSLEAREGGR